jgi:hypothetical protein
VRLATCVLLACILVSAPPAAAQQQRSPEACGTDTVINIYRHVLDLEPPESPALVALGATTSYTRAATAPKPLALSLVSMVRGAAAPVTGAAIDVSPYFLVGGGARSLCSYRENSIAGRMTRVGIKTIVSVGVLPLGGFADAVRFGVGIRSTMHDPHDPINNSELVRRLPPAAPDDELPPAVAAEPSAYQDAARSMRARDRSIVSGGWGAATTLVDGSFSSREGGWRHALWLSWQRTLDARFDMLFTGEASLERGEASTYRLTTAARRKHGAADLLLEAAFDTGDERLHYGLSGEARVAARVRAAVGILTEPAAPPSGGRVLRATVSVRWSAGY